RLNFMHQSHEAGSVSRKAIGGKPPALFTSRSTRPNSRIVVATTASICAGFVTSHGMASARCPKRRAASAVLPIFFSVRAAQTTCAPCSANASAIACPIPRPAPVTTATLSVRRNRSSNAIVARILGDDATHVNQTPLLLGDDATQVDQPLLPGDDATQVDHTL